MAFRIKQNDTLPNLPFKILQPDGIAAQPLDDVVEINIVVRVKGGQPTAPVIFKKPCTILDQGVPANVGWGFYAFVAADTANPGNYEYELEIEWEDGSIQTVPVDGYLDLIIVDDIG